MPLDLTNLYAGLQKASAYNPVDKKTLQKALKPYKLNLTSSAGKSDSQLRRLAAKAVLARYKAAQKQK